MKKHLHEFQNYKQSLITFDSFNISFYEGFVKYLTYEVIMLRRNKLVKGLKINTIGKTVKHLKCFLKDRMARKIIPFIDLSFFKYLEEQVAAVYLSWDELSKINHLDLSADPCLVKYRDMFILGCLTGFRFRDYSNIQFDDLRDGMLDVTQKKTLVFCKTNNHEIFNQTNYQKGKTIKRWEPYSIPSILLYERKARVNQLGNFYP